MDSPSSEDASDNASDKEDDNTSEKNNTYEKDTTSEKGKAPPSPPSRELFDATAAEKDETEESDPEFSSTATTAVSVPEATVD